MDADFIEAFKQIEREKELDTSTLLKSVEKAFVIAYKQSKNTEQEVNLRIELGGTGKNALQVLRLLRVVEAVTNPFAEISLADARTAKPNAQIDDTIEERIGKKEIEQMGRIASLKARQVLQQDIREGEREKVFDEYNDRIGDVLTGTISRREGSNIIISLGKLEAILPVKEQVPSERYRFNDRIKVFVFEVRKGPKGPTVIVSRTHPSLIRRLFELEVPEIHDGIVSIKSVAREPGARSKIAVGTHEERVDPVGACVGHRGARVQAVVNELYDEKIDIVRWSGDNKQFITESLSPARVSSVQLDDDAKSAFVVVPDNQLSLAIGKSGQNVRLAARLTGWRIDIHSESQIAKQVFLDAAAALEDAPEDPEAEAALPPITFGDEPMTEMTETMEATGEMQALDENVPLSFGDMPDAPETDLTEVSGDVPATETEAAA